MPAHQLVAAIAAAAAHVPINCSLSEESRRPGDVVWMDHCHTIVAEHESNEVSEVSDLFDPPKPH